MERDVPNINRALKSANLVSNNIGDEGAAAISKALETNNTLETLILGDVLGGNDIGAAGAQAIAKMLVVNRALTSVNLLKNDLGDGTAAVVAAAKQQGKIKTLCGIKEDETEINWNGQYARTKLKAPDAVLLSFDLEFNRSLNSVDLRNNQLRDAGKQQLRDAVGDKSITLKL